MSTGQDSPQIPAKKRVPTQKKQVFSSQAAGEKQRLQRVMAAAGIGSRRECELIIQEGRVEVDGQIVATLGVKVDPHQQKIFVDGERLTMERLEYFALNKPPGVVSTSRDPSGRARVIDLIKTDQRVYNVGRLDQSSEGLILITNDGDLANQLTHPKFGIEKRYHVQVDGVPETRQLKSLEEGIYIAEGKAKATSARLLKKTGTTSWLEIVLSEGRNREIRRLLAKIGHKVRTLRRVAIGPLKMADLPVGAHRRLTTQEVKLLRQAASGVPVTEAMGSPKPARSRRAPGARAGHKPLKSSQPSKRGAGGGSTVAQPTRGGGRRSDDPTQPTNKKIPHRKFSRKSDKGNKVRGVPQGQTEERTGEQTSRTLKSGRSLPKTETNAGQKRRGKHPGKLSGKGEQPGFRSRMKATAGTPARSTRKPARGATQLSKLLGGSKDKAQGSPTGKNRTGRTSSKQQKPLRQKRRINPKGRSR